MNIGEFMAERSSGAYHAAEMIEFVMGEYCNLPNADGAKFVIALKDISKGSVSNVFSVSLELRQPSGETTDAIVITVSEGPDRDTFVYHAACTLKARFALFGSGLLSTDEIIIHVMNFVEKSAPDIAQKTVTRWVPD